MASSSEHTRTYSEPRITANELARFMVTGDIGRLGIIRRARESGTPPRTRYKDAKAALKVALLDPAGERRVIAEASNRLTQMSRDSAVSDFRRNDALKSLEVLNAFGGLRQKLSGYDYVAAPYRQASLSISGVEVPVTLDLLIHEDRERPSIGGLLFRLTQADESETDRAAAKRRDMGLFAATLVHMHVTANLAGDRNPNHDICWSVDVQCQEVHVAPRTYAQRAQSIEAACRFIASAWGTA